MPPAESRKKGIVRDTFESVGEAVAESVQTGVRSPLPQFRQHDILRTVESPDAEAGLAERFRTLNEIEPLPEGKSECRIRRLPQNLGVLGVTPVLRTEVHARCNNGDESC